MHPLSKRQGMPYDRIMKELCIFTPTFNRAYCLDNLYRSLVEQTTLDFHWLIVDDGSSDDTEDLVESFKTTSPFPITYIKQHNGGKQRAHNTGVAHCEDDLFFCVDSDDLLAPRTVEIIKQAWSAWRNDPTVAGMVGLCGSDATTPLGTRMPHDAERITFWDLYYRRKHKGDSAPVYRTEVLKKFPFDVAEGEKFIAEPYVYHQIDQHYTLGVIDEVLIVREYLEDGYTNNVRKVTRENPLGYMKLKLLYLTYSDTLYLKFYNSILYQIGCILSGTRNGSAQSPCKIITKLAYLPALLLAKTVYRP